MGGIYFFLSFFLRFTIFGVGTLFCLFSEGVHFFAVDIKANERLKKTALDGADTQTERQTNRRTWQLND